MVNFHCPTRDAIRRGTALLSRYYLLSIFLPQAQNIAVAINAAGILVTLSYVTMEYVWPALKRRFFSTSFVQQKLQLDKPLALTKYEEEIALSGAIHPSQIKSSFADIGGHDQILGQLVGNLSAMLRPRDDPRIAHLVNSKLYQPPSGILLYGPPGCGKTLIAKALAAESGARFINVPLALLFDKWVGETEKYLEALFTLARKIQPTIIFIDEIDSLTKRRSEMDSSWNSTMKSQFLSLWDGLMTDKTCKIVLLGATNRSQDIDEAFMRRMPLQIKLDLPDSLQRAEILRVLLSDIQVGPDVSVAKLANSMPGFSGSDMREVCRRVVMESSLKHEPGAMDMSNFETVVKKFKMEKAVNPTMLCLD